MKKSEKTLLQSFPKDEEKSENSSTTTTTSGTSYHLDIGLTNLAFYDYGYVIDGDEDLVDVNFVYDNDSAYLDIKGLKKGDIGIYLLSYNDSGKISGYSKYEFNINSKLNVKLTGMESSTNASDLDMPLGKVHKIDADIDKDAIMNSWQQSIIDANPGVNITFDN